MNNITTGIPGTNRCGKAMMMLAGLLLLGLYQPSVSFGQQPYQMEEFEDVDQLVEAKVDSEYRLVSLDLKNVTLTNALRQLAQQGKVGLSFQPEHIPDKKVTAK